MTEEAQSDRKSVEVAVVDDDYRICDTIARYVRKTGCATQLFEGGEACLSALNGTTFDIVVTDLQMEGIDGLEVLRCVKEQSPSTDVIIVTGNADKSTAIQAVKLGAFDFFEKPVEPSELMETIKRTVRFRTIVQERDRYAEQVSFLSQREAKQWGIESFVGRSAAIKRILREVQLVQRATSTSVLVIGESGTGKELVARAIHYGGPRASAPFIPVNCAAVPSELAESILFGHTKGSFTGATSSKKGCFELADGGTLFLDEIGDMPAAMQTKLLRVLEDGVVTPVGGTRGVNVDVRVVAATNSNLQERIVNNDFRPDLYYRLAAYTISVPPLRDRKEEIPLLAEHFAKSLSSEMGITTPSLNPDVLEVLKEHSFPGNVRELRNVIERALIESCGSEVKPNHLHFLQTADSGTPAAKPGPPPSAETDREPAGTAEKLAAELPLNLKEAEAILIRRAMAATNENVSAAARLLGINRTKLYRKLATVQEN